MPFFAGRYETLWKCMMCMIMLLILKNVFENAWLLSKLHPSKISHCTVYVWLLTLTSYCHYTQSTTWTEHVWPTCIVKYTCIQICSLEQMCHFVVVTWPYTYMWEYVSYAHSYRWSGYLEWPTQEKHIGITDIVYTMEFLRIAEWTDNMWTSVPTQSGCPSTYAVGHFFVRSHDVHSPLYPRPRSAAIRHLTAMLRCSTCLFPLSPSQKPLSHSHDSVNPHP